MYITDKTKDLINNIIILAQSYIFRELYSYNIKIQKNLLLLQW